MSTESTPSYSSEAPTEPISIITEQSDTETRESLPPRLILKLSSMALAPILGLGIGTFLADNKYTIEDNYKAATAFNDRNNELSEIGSELIGMPIRVDCNDETLDMVGELMENNQDYTLLGMVEPFTLPFDTTVSVPVTTLRESICDNILDFKPGVGIDSPDYSYEYHLEAAAYAESVSILLHESEHVKQVHNEAEATCYAFQKLGSALLTLGFDEETASFLSERAAYTQSEMLAPEYFSDECQPDGQYDLSISDVYISDPNTPSGTVIQIPVTN